MPDSQATYELDLISRLVHTSQVLASQLYPPITGTPDHELDGYVGTWHVKDPDFSKIDISIGDQNISKALNDLAQRTNELLISMTLSPATTDEELGYIPPQYIWEAGPPVTSEGIFFFSGLQGLAFSLYIPVKISDISQEDIKRLREYGAINLDLLQWNDLDEVLPYNGFRTKKENIMLDLIGCHSIERLEVALWLVDGVTRVKDVHLEESYRS
ncbi:MAG: hypothetical protein IH934_06255 [Nanoarchaeota archaeon]|nr:hypothetical protein [Nanoarchaeota archaeon]